MAGNDVFAHVVALHGLVDGVSVVDEEGDPLPIPAVGADADVVPVAEDHNVPGLPLGGIVQVSTWAWRRKKVSRLLTRRKSMLPSGVSMLG